MEDFQNEIYRKIFSIWIQLYFLFFIITKLNTTFLYSICYATPTTSVHLPQSYISYLSRRAIDDLQLYAHFLLPLPFTCWHQNSELSQLTIITETIPPKRSLPIPLRLEKYRREGALPQTQSEKGLLSLLQGNRKKMKKQTNAIRQSNQTSSTDPYSDHWFSRFS